MSKSAEKTERLARISNRAAGRPLSKPIARLHAALYKASGGRIGRGWFGVIVIEALGRKSGQIRHTPILGMRDGGNLVVLAANAGAERDPQWWLNLRAAGRGTAIVGSERRPVRPRVAEGSERERLWARFLDFYPASEHYVTYTDRPLPLVVLEPDPDPPVS